MSEIPYYGDDIANINWIKEGYISKKELLNEKYGISKTCILVTRLIFIFLIYLILILGPEHFRNMILALFYSLDKNESSNENKSILKDHNSYNYQGSMSKKYKNELSFYDTSICCFIFSVVLCLIVIVFNRLNFRIKGCLTVCSVIGFLISIIIYIFSYNFLIEYYNERSEI